MNKNRGEHMKQDEIIEWANLNALQVQHTQQGTDLQDMFDMTLVTGPVDNPLETAKSMFDEPQRKFEQSTAADFTSTVYGFDDERVVLVVVEQDESSDPNWLHIMLYETDELYERGWATQVPAQATEPTKADLLSQIESLTQQVLAMPD